MVGPERVPVCELSLVHDEVSRDTVLFGNCYSKFESNSMPVNLIKVRILFLHLRTLFHFPSNYFHGVLLKY